MNWILVGLLSILWLVLAVFATLVIARTAGTRYFLHGLAVGIAWGLLNGVIAAALFGAYREHNPEVMASTSRGSPSPVMFLGGAPVIGLVTGLVLGLLAWGASRVIEPATPLEDSSAAPATTP
jgi:hypothetical protein